MLEAGNPLQNQRRVQRRSRYAPYKRAYSGPIAFTAAMSPFFIAAAIGVKAKDLLK